MEIFRVEWKGLYPLVEAPNKQEARELGIYAVYKPSKKLWYIGKSQEIGKRLDEHIQEWSHILTKNEIKALAVRFGKIYSYEGSQPSFDISKDQLNDIESFFINTYKSEGNADITKMGYKGRPIMVINTGNRYSFKKIMSHNLELVKFLKETFTQRKSKPSSWL